MSTVIRSTGIDPDVHGCAFAYITEHPDGKRDLQVMVVRQKEGVRRAAAVELIKQEAFDLAVCTFPGQVHMPDVITVEGQDIRYTGRTTFANPQDLCDLALVTGAAVGLAMSPRIYSPLPREWKGSVRKDIKQKRILSEMGIPYEMKGGRSPYPVPKNWKKYAAGKVNAGDWKDLTDAVGLALWGLKKLKLEQKGAS